MAATPSNYDEEIARRLQAWQQIRQGALCSFWLPENPQQPFSGGRLRCIAVVQRGEKMWEVIMLDRTNIAAIVTGMPCQRVLLSFWNAHLFEVEYAPA